jgi:hypothetical protein
MEAAATPQLSALKIGIGRKANVEAPAPAPAVALKLNHIQRGRKACLISISHLAPPTHIHNRFHFGLSHSCNHSQGEFHFLFIYFYFLA